MHLLVLLTSSGLGRELAANRWRTCMLGLSFMQSSWPVGGWVYRLFSRIMKTMEAKAVTTSRFPSVGPDPDTRASETSQPQQSPFTSLGAASHLERYRNGIETQPASFGVVGMYPEMDGFMSHDRMISNNMSSASADDVTSFDQGLFFDILNSLDWGTNSVEI